jgi:4-hydroxybenzoate polyprenyltransferase
LSKTIGFLRLMRPANVVTSIADVLAGIAITGYFTGWPFDYSEISDVLMLCLATAGLYAGGVVFNDVFDADLDRIERPERPIPSGLIPVIQAAIVGTILIVLGIMAAFKPNLTTGILAIAIAISALVYDKWGKHHNLLGPLNMGLCRGLNILLGISILPDSLDKWWFIAFVPIIYIASITMISRGEVHGSNRTPLYAAAVLYAVVIGAILYFASFNGMAIFAIVFLVFLAWMIYRPLFKAISEPSGPNIGKAVKAGVISLIIMNAAWAAAAGALEAAVLIILLLPLSFWLAKKFAVT